MLNFNIQVFLKVIPVPCWDFMSLYSYSVIHSLFLSFPTLFSRNSLFSSHLLSVTYCLKCHFCNYSVAEIYWYHSISKSHSIVIQFTQKSHNLLKAMSENKLCSCQIYVIFLLLTAISFLFVSITNRPYVNSIAS